MAREDLTRVSVYVSQGKQGQKPLQRLAALGKAQDQSLNYMIVEAVFAFVRREEKK